MALPLKLILYGHNFNGTVFMARFSMDTIAKLGNAVAMKIEFIRENHSLETLT